MILVGAYFGFILDAVCLQDKQGNYCFSVFKQLDDLEGDALTPAKLQVLCTPCFFKMINLLLTHPIIKSNATEQERSGK